MNTLPFDEDEIRYLRSQHLARLATVDKRGAPQNNPVGFRLNAETGSVDIHGYALGATKKFRNVRTNPLVALVIDDLASLSPWHVRGIEIRGRAEALAGVTPVNDVVSPEVLRIHPETIFTWGLGTKSGRRTVH
jgi:pyridoxamine 5'-phosphate oxidase family protein